MFIGVLRKYLVGEGARGFIARRGFYHDGENVRDMVVVLLSSLCTPTRSIDGSLNDGSESDKYSVLRL